MLSVNHVYAPDETAYTRILIRRVQDKEVSVR
jgi:hypothetical protein